MSRAAGGKLEAAGRTDTGLVRSKNEDALLLRDDVGLLAVADGMGGAPAGEVASGLAVEELEAALTGSLASTEEPRAPCQRMARAVEGSHRRILKDQEGRPERRGMGTTLTALHVDPGSGRFTLGHVGDSRAYRLRGGELKLLTRDHTWVQEEVERGRLSPRAARTHPGRHMLTRALGVGTGGPAQVEEGALEPGDVLLLCTDGLLAALDEEAIAGVLGRLGGSSGLRDAVDELMESAHARGSPDNVALVLARWEDA